MKKKLCILFSNTLNPKMKKHNKPGVTIGITISIKKKNE